MEELNQTELNTGTISIYLGHLKFHQEFMMKKDSLVMNNMRKCSHQASWPRIKSIQDTKSEPNYLFK